MLGKIGIKIDIPKLRKFDEVAFGLGEGDVKSVVSPDEIDLQRTTAGLIAGARTSQQALTQVAQAQTGGGLTVNFNGTVTNPQDAKDVVIQGLKEFNRTEGALNRMITIE